MKNIVKQIDERRNEERRKEAKRHHYLATYIYLIVKCKRIVLIRNFEMRMMTYFCAGLKIIIRESTDVYQLYKESIEQSVYGK